MKVDDPTNLPRAAVLLRRLYKLAGTPIPDSIAVARLDSPDQLDMPVIKRSRLTVESRIAGGLGVLMRNFAASPSLFGDNRVYHDELRRLQNRYLPETYDITTRLDIMQRGYKERPRALMEDMKEHWHAAHKSWHRKKVEREAASRLTPAEAKRMLAILKELAETAFAWGGGPNTPFVIAAPRLRLDERDRLHSEVGPAVIFPDGYGYSYLQGTEVPSGWVLEEPRYPKPIQAMSWPNTDQRRVLIEKMGWAALMKAMHAEEIDRNPDPAIGTLFSATATITVNAGWMGRRKERRNFRLLQVLCGTGREFMIPVPDNCRTALEAQAWTWGKTAGTFKKPEVRT